MAEQKYLIQLKLPAGSFILGKYSEGKEITAESDDEAIKKGRQYLQDRKSLGQCETGFRVLKIVHEEGT